MLPFLHTLMQQTRSQTARKFVSNFLLPLETTMMFCYADKRWRADIVKKVNKQSKVKENLYWQIESNSEKFQNFLSDSQTAKD